VLPGPARPAAGRGGVRAVAVAGDAPAQKCDSLSLKSRLKVVIDP
jgi:hypothetical protein